MYRNCFWAGARKARREKHQTPHKVQDITVIGCGISGLYVARQLSDYSRDLDMVLYEKNAYLGGRIITKRFDNFVVEYGPIRFETGIQSTLMRLLVDLDINVEKVTDLYITEKEPNYEKLSSEEFQVLTKEVHSRVPKSTRAIMYAMKCVLKDQWDFESTPLHETELELRKSILKKYGTFDGKRLCEYGILDLFRQVLSRECLKFVVEQGYFYYMIDKNPNAAEHICVLLDIMESFRWDFVRIPGGVQSIVGRLSETLNKEISIQTSMELCEVQEKRDYYRLTFKDGSKADTKRLILALPPNSLMDIKGIGNILAPIIKNHLMVVQLFRIFVIVDNPPWSQNRTEIVAELPCREISYFVDHAKNEGMIMFYGDDRNSKYWFSVEHQETLAPREKSKLVKDKLQNLLTAMYPAPSKPWKIKVVEINNFEPNGWNGTEQGVYLWKSGIDCQSVNESLSCFSLSSKGRKNVHVCGESFSEYQCFMEGALRSAEKVARRICLLG